ncbi:MAG TPA: hypothetical protein VGB17_15160 [Pyrinomonadaceae bacterium]|jgi:hypothetical protein
MKTTGPKRGKKRKPQPLFETIRKPLAPPGHPLGRDKPEERAHPSLRKAKHKHRPERSGEGTEGD